MKYRISVAMATYNGAKFIEEQLLSILNQTRQVDELILYDDCSTDETCEIVKSMQDMGVNIKLCSQEKRVGYVKNFASALKETTGELIFLCDQDDIWEREKIAEMTALFENDNQMVCVASGFTFMDVKGEEINKQDKGNNHGLCWNIYEKNKAHWILCDELMFHNIAMGCTMAFRSSIKEEYLQKSKLLSAHDWEILFLAACKHGAMFYNRPLIRYRIHENNTAGNDKIHKKAHIYEATRERNAQSLYTSVQALVVYMEDMNPSQKKMIHTLVQFHKKRVAMLCDGHTRYWVSLLKKYKIYKKITSKKGIIIDFLYSIHK